MFSIYVHFSGRGPIPLKISFDDEETRDGAFKLIHHGINIPNGSWSNNTVSLRTDKIDFIIKDD
jgi:hypothetical protein